MRLYSVVTFACNVCPWQTDRFVLEAVDLGELYKVKVRHDDSSFGSAWYLDRIEVIDLVGRVGEEGGGGGQETYTFHCERWLAKKKDDGKIERNLYVKVSSVALMRSNMFDTF